MRQPGFSAPKPGAKEDSEWPPTLDRALLLRGHEGHAGLAVARRRDLRLPGSHKRSDRSDNRLARGPTRRRGSVDVSSRHEGHAGLGVARVRVPAERVPPDEGGRGGPGVVPRRWPAPRQRVVHRMHGRPQWLVVALRGRGSGRGGLRMRVKGRLMSCRVVGGSTWTHKSGGCMRVAWVGRGRGHGATQQELRVGRVAATVLLGRRAESYL